jgi:hypothetical protein
MLCRLISKRLKKPFLTHFLRIHWRVREINHALCLAGKHALDFNRVHFPFARTTQGFTFETKRSLALRMI